MSDSEQRPAAPAGAPEPRTVGQILKKARAAQDLSLEQLATELRIEAPQLQALEQDKFERIGVPVFVKGYLRQYGQRLGVDYRDLLAQYYKQTNLEEVQIQPSRTIKLHDERQITVWIVAGLLLLLVAVSLAVWWLNGGGFELPTVTRLSPALNEMPQPVARPAVDVQAAVSVPPAVAAMSSAINTTAAAGEAQAPPVPPPAAEARELTASEENDAAAGVTRPPFIVSLDVTFEQESWAEITDARGERLFFGMGAAGRRSALRGEPPFAVVLGNADGVRMVVDGEDYVIPTSSRQGNLARFTVDIAEE